MDPVGGILNKLVVAAPLVLVTTLGLHSRTALEQHQYVAYSPTHNQEVSNYIDVVRATEGIKRKRFLLDEASARMLGKEWIAGSKTGLLKPLAPIAIDDTSRDGVKAQITRDCTLVAESLNYAAEQHLAKGDYRGALSDTLMATKTTEVVKYFDFCSIALCSMIERKSLSMVVDETKHLTPEEKALVRREVSSLATSPTMLKQMTYDARFILTQRSDDSKALDNYLATENLAKKSFQEENQRIAQVASDDGELSDMLNEYRLGLTAVTDTDRHVTEVLKSI